MKQGSPAGPVGARPRASVPPGTAPPAKGGATLLLFFQEAIMGLGMTVFLICLGCMALAAVVGWLGIKMSD